MAQLDDTLAAVDADTAQWLVNEAVLSMLSTKLVVFATNHVGLLPSDTRVLVLDHGKVILYPGASDSLCTIDCT